MSGIRSPSLANSHQQHRPEKVGVCFEECTELPLLLSRAVVGAVDHRATLCVFRLLNRSFRDGVRDAMGEWMAALAALQREWIESGDKNPEDLNYTVLARMAELMDTAFGEGFSQGYQENTLMSSHTPRAYMAMLGRRCMITQDAFPPPSKKRVERAANSLFCFAHPRSQGQFTITVKPKTLGMSRERAEAVWRECMSGPNYQLLVDTCDIESLNTPASRLVDTLARWHPGFPSTFEALKAHLAPYTKHINAHSDQAITVWVGDHSVDTSAWVKPEDTLLGMLHISAKDVAAAKERSVAAGRRAARERSDRALKRREFNEKRRRDREGELRLALGRPASVIKWRTVEEIAALHPNALDTVGCFDYFSGGMEITLDKLLHRIRFLQYLLQGITQTLSSSTVGYLFMNPALFNWACPQNTAAPYNPALLRFLDALDHLAPNDNCYEIQSVRRPIGRPVHDPAHPTWRMNSVVSWSRGRLERPLSYQLRESEIRLAEAKLRLVGLSVKSFPKGDELTSKNMAEYVRDIVDCSFKTRDRRLIGYDLLGLTSGTGQEIASCLDMEGHLYNEPAPSGEMVWHVDADEDSNQEPDDGEEPGDVGW